MTISVTNKSPAPDDVDVSSGTFVKLSIQSDDPLDPVIQGVVDVELGGRQFISGGQPVEGFDATITPNANLGFDVTMRDDLPSETWVGVLVTVSAFSDSWSFRVGDSEGPRAISILPTPFKDGASTTPTVSFTLVDDHHPPVLRVLEQEANDGSRAGSQVTSPSLDFRRSLGRMIEVDGTEDEVVDVLGPYDVLVNNSGPLSGVNVKVFQDRGLDVWVGGEQVIESGYVKTAPNWTAAAPVVNATSIDISVSRTGPALVAGERVEVQVKAPDGDQSFVNISMMSWSFEIGDAAPPRVENILPAEGSKGLDVLAANTQPSFDLVDDVDGVDASTVDVLVDGIAAITGGVAQAGFVGSTVGASGNTVPVTIIKDSDWTDGDQVFIEIDADDLGAKAMPKKVYSLHFGNGQDELDLSVVAGNLPEDNIVRVVAFDLGETSFANPVTMHHTGYAYDGCLYDKGFKVVESPSTGVQADNLASWFTESPGVDRGSQATFPVSGYVVATPGYWTILDQNGNLWMRCPTFTFAGSLDDWTMAGNSASPIADVDFGEDAVLFVASESIVVVDFTRDSATRFSQLGKEASVGDISGRASNQSTPQPDQLFALDGSGFDLVAGRALQGDDHSPGSGLGVDQSYVFTACRSTKMQVVGDLSAEWLSAIEGIRGELSNNRVVEFDLGTVTWISARMSSRTVSGVLAGAVCRNESGQMKVSTFDWLDVLTDQFPSLLNTYDNLSSPALAADDANDMDMVRDDDRWVMAVASDAAIDLIDVDGAQVVQRSGADVGLDVGDIGANPHIDAVAMERSFEFGLGHLYAAGTGDTSSRVVRYREQSPSASASGQVTEMSTEDLNTLSAMGDTELDAEQMIRASVNIATEGSSMIRASVEVA